jgi:PEGA domain
MKRAAAARPAPLRVEADVPDASVFVDHRFVGKAPVDVRDLALGPHRVNVSADGFPLHAEEVELGDEPRTISVRFSEVHLDESLAVIHKHAVGSCSGVLRASPEGLAFEAASVKDSFRAPFALLSRFDVDYLGKTLRLSLRGGRSYNFTVEGSSADPLLVFQQKVDAVRKRLHS